MEADTSVRHAEALALADRGRWRAARERALTALGDDPDDPLTRSLLARADAELGRMSISDAEAAVRRLSDEHPDVKALRMRAAALMARRGDRVEALRVARAILEEDQADAAAQEFVAGLSCCEDEVTESFLHFKMALDLGGLRRPASRLMALVQARRLHEPASTRARILTGASPFERVALRTAASRAVGYVIFAVAVLGWVLGGLGHAWLGALGVAVASALAAWRTSCCLYICWTRQELKRFATMVGSVWIVFLVVAWAGSDFPTAILVACVAVSVAIFEVKARTRRSRSVPADTDASTWQP